MQHEIADMFTFGHRGIFDDLVDITSKTVTDIASPEGFLTFLAWVQTPEVVVEVRPILMIPASTCSERP